MSTACRQKSPAAELMKLLHGAGHVTLPANHSSGQTLFSPPDGFLGNVVWLDDDTPIRALINTSRMPDSEAVTTETGGTSQPGEQSKGEFEYCRGNHQKPQGIVGKCYDLAGRRGQGSDDEDDEEEEGEVDEGEEETAKKRSEEIEGRDSDAETKTKSESGQVGRHLTNHQVY